MPVPSPTTELTRPAPVESVNRSTDAARESASQAPKAQERGVRVSISSDGRAALASAETTERALGTVAREIGLSEEAQESAGREEFLAKTRLPKEPTTEAIAARVYEGIQTYLFEAFQLENPHPRREQLERYADDAAKGLDRGLRDAANLLLAFGARREELQAARAETFERVRNHLTEFAEARAREAEVVPEPRDEIQLPELDLLGDGSTAKEAKAVG